MKIGAFEQACVDAGAGREDDVWFIDMHPTPEQTRVELTKHDRLGWGITDPPLAVPVADVVDDGAAVAAAEIPEPPEDPPDDVPAAEPEAPAESPPAEDED